MLLILEKRKYQGQLTSLSSLGRGLNLRTVFNVQESLDPGRLISPGIGALVFSWKALKQLSLVV